VLFHVLSNFGQPSGRFGFQTIEPARELVGLTLRVLIAAQQVLDLPSRVVAPVPTTAEALTSTPTAASRPTL
jgi:hypothetical protein